MVTTQQLSVPFVVGKTVLLLFLTCVTAMPLNEYNETRQLLLDKDTSTAMGQKLTMSANEKLVSDVLVKEKSKLIEDSRVGRQSYFPALSFYESKHLIEKTNIYRIIRDMPKGGVLHVHDMAITSLDWLISNVTYRDHLYMCVDKNTQLMVFHFYKTPPTNSDCVWKLVKELREMSSSADTFDLSLKSNLSLLATDPFVTYPTLSEVWGRFGPWFMQVFGLIFYKPVFQDHFRRGLEEFAADNVQYFELRALMGGVYDLDGNFGDTKGTFDLYRTALADYMTDHPDFIGAKFILCGDRSKGQDVIMQEVKSALEIRENYPDLLLGYDLVAQEDPNHTLMYFIKQLLYPSQLDPPVKLPFFFHAAETDWQGTGTDDNLIDAILLNTSRIGHGYGLPKHPTLVKQVREKGIAVEANPISNQLLGLFKDPRNHALVPLIADDFPLVVSSDDPVVWEAAPLSSDFYMAFMNMCGEDNCDIRFLKQLAINSIKYSGMTEQEKQTAMVAWQTKWDKFIENEALAIKAENGEQCSADSFCP